MLRPPSQIVGVECCDRPCDQPTFSEHGTRIAGLVILDNEDDLVPETFDEAYICLPGFPLSTNDKGEGFVSTGNYVSLRVADMNEQLANEVRDGAALDETQEVDEDSISFENHIFCLLLR